MYILPGIPGGRSCTLAACYPFAPDGNMHIPKGKSPKGKNENTEDFTMKKHLIDFPENNISIESFYDRLRPCYDSIMQFGDRDFGCPDELERHAGGSGIRICGRPRGRLVTD